MGHDFKQRINRGVRPHRGRRIIHGGAGIFTTGARGTVTNTGTVTGGAYGVGLNAGGMVTNTSVIIGGEDGVRIYRW